MNASMFPPETDGGVVSLAELKSALGSVALIDVREPHEFDAGHIPGAVNQPLSTFDPSDLPVGKPIVLVCQAGARSARALNVAKAAGVADIRHYAGGTGGWRANGEPLEV